MLSFTKKRYVQEFKKRGQFPLKKKLLDMSIYSFSGAFHEKLDLRNSLVLPKIPCSSVMSRNRCHVQGR